MTNKRMQLYFVSCIHIFGFISMQLCNRLQPVLKIVFVAIKQHQKGVQGKASIFIGAFFVVLDKA